VAPEVDPHDEDPVFQVALRVADDRPVDWERIRTLADGARGAVDRLREIEALGRAYRVVGASRDEEELPGS
jgi:hypothetical protein